MRYISYRKTILAVIIILLLSFMFGCLNNPTDNGQSTTKPIETTENTETSETKQAIDSTMMSDTSVPETTITPETIASDTTIPETTITPETIASETTVPETTVPETTVPETTVPETTVPETTAPIEPHNVLVKVNQTRYYGLGHICAGVMPIINSDNLCGLVNVAGEMIIECKYESFQNLSADGSIVFEDKYLYDKTGKLLYTATDATIVGYSEGILVLSRGGHTIYCTADGKIIKDIPEAWGSMFNKQGYAVYSYEGYDGYDSVVIDKDGNKVYSTQDSGPYKGDLICVDGQFDTVLLTKRRPTATYIMVDIFTKEYFTLDIKTETAEQPFYLEDMGCWFASDQDRFYTFTDGDLIVCGTVEGPRMLANIRTGEILSKGYSEISLVKGSELLLVSDGNGNYGYIDRTGKEIAMYEGATIFYGDYAMIITDGKAYVVDENLNKLTEGIPATAVAALGDGYFAIGPDGESTRYLMHYIP